ncbi:helix-turn-helix domain-containing protein [Aliarcobacter butzleri]|uniref:helix-turn-helix domain-containing protein n=1 Tax=Aliarcobacter butzleri TaxID=28197 RepID=UPI001EDBEE9E|nr:helix-turn-helix domain-containing protein [Aliarcobacter butzleri]MCG3660099.1 helix-turn-helix domain-containing protein [Aliarcobacter butzleri]
MGNLYHELVNNFTQIPNLIISDTNIKHISFRLYCYYASKPNGWKIRNADIKEKLGISKDTIASANKNLSDNGWLNRFKEKNTNGTFNGSFSYQLYSVPTEIRKNPISVKPEIGKKPTLNNTKIKETPDLSNLDYFKIMYQLQQENKPKGKNSEFYTSVDGNKRKKQLINSPRAIKQDEIKF